MNDITELGYIEDAAKGGMTGELGEWPFLANALRNRGYPLPPDTPAAEVIALCRQLLDEQARA